MRPHIIVEQPRWWVPLELGLALLGAFVAGFLLRGMI